MGAARRVNMIGNFYPDKVVGDVMRKFIAEQKAKGDDLDIDVNGTDEQIAVALSIRFQERTKKDDMCKCDRCAGEAPDTLETCPFCGLGGDVDADGEEEETLDDPPNAVQGDRGGKEDAHDDTTSTAADDEGETQGGDDTTPPVSKKKSKKDKAGAKESRRSKDTSGAKKDDAPKEDDMRGTSAAKVTTSDEATTTQSLVQVKGKGASMAKLTVKDLDAAVKEVLEAKITTWAHSIDLGKKLLDINVRQLWKLRVDDKGKAKYTGFDAFVHHELNMSQTMAYNLLNLAREYGNDGDAARLGKSKASILLKAPPQDREALKQEALASNMSKRELAEKVQQKKKERGYEGEGAKAKAGTKSAAAKKAKKEAAQKATLKANDKVSIAFTEGKKTVKLFSKPASLRNLDMNDLKRAKAIGDLPFGRVELTNEMVLYVTVHKTDAGLVASLDFRRETAAAAE